MRYYRVYLLNKDLAIEAADSFEASGDIEAIVYASALYATCSDVVSGYELWQSVFLLDRFIGEPLVGQAALEAILRAHQANFADSEEELQSLPCTRRRR